MSTRRSWLQSWQARAGTRAAWVWLGCCSLCQLGQAATGEELELGRSLYESRCGACHGLDANRVGPMHRQLIGRRAGQVAGYAYSPALKSSAVVWTAQTLDQWLSNPEAMIPGQRMNFSVPSAEDRRLLIEYLGSDPVNARPPADRAP